MEKQKTVRKADGSYRVGLYKKRSKGKTKYYVIENMVNGINNPRGTYFASKEEAEEYLNDEW